MNRNIRSFTYTRRSIDRPTIGSRAHRAGGSALLVGATSAAERRCTFREAMNQTHCLLELCLSPEPSDLPAVAVPGGGRFVSFRVQPSGIQP